MQDLTNYIFKHKKSFYKILKYYENPNHWSMYRRKGYEVVKCTKTGKEFQRYDHFSAEYVEEKFNNNEGFFVKKNKEKCKTDNINNGINKRRVTYLKNHINKYKKELENLEKELENLEKIIY